MQRSTYCANQASLGMGTFDPGEQVCAIDPPYFGDGICSGDSGGPLLAQRADGTWVEIGVTSSAPSNCNTRQADFFTRADAISAWATSWVQASRPPQSQPAPSPSLPPPAVPTAPLAGIYRGHTSQRWPITLRVATSRRKVIGLRFSFRLYCTRHRPLSFSIAPTISWQLTAAGGIRFGHSFSDRTGERYRISGAFSTTGAVAGTLTTSWQSRRYGICSSGLVHWRAGANSSKGAESAVGAGSGDFGQWVGEPHDFTFSVACSPAVLGIHAVTGNVVRTVRIRVSPSNRARHNRRRIPSCSAAREK